MFVFTLFRLGFDMKALLLATVALLALATTANRWIVDLCNLIITQISPENPTTFNNLPTGTNGIPREFDGVRFRLLRRDPGFE